jgi:hypothetical protein
MALNDRYFAPPEATQTLLRVRGFSPNGLRSGGVESPQIVDLPGGTVLFRLYHDPTRDYGEWWATPKPWEYKANLPRIGGGMSGQSLLDEVARYRSQRLAFE